MTGKLGNNVGINHNHNVEEDDDFAFAFVLDESQSGSVWEATVDEVVVRKEGEVVL